MADRGVPLERFRNTVRKVHNGRTFGRSIPGSPVAKVLSAIAEEDLHQSVNGFFAAFGVTV